jgi:hypothetical protein
MMEKRLKSEIAQRELGNLGCRVCASVEQVGSHTTVAYCLNKSLYLLFNTPVLAANLPEPDIFRSFSASVFVHNLVR